jgi:uncharacterized OB-fold protein
MAPFMPDNWPIPALDRFNRDFFTSGRIVVQECVACGTVQHPPDAACNNCKAMEFRSRETNGAGTVYSYIVVHNPPAPALAEAVPYAVALVSLDEFPHVRILGNVLNREPGEVAIGQRVQATFEEIDDAESGERILLPQWVVV